MRQSRTGSNMVKSSSPNAPSTWPIFLCPHTHTSPQTCHHSASSVLAVQISFRVTAVFVFRKQKRRMEELVYTHKLKYLLTNKIFLLQAMYRYVHMIFVVKCVTITCFFIACGALWWKSMIFIVLSSVETVQDNVQYRYCIFSLLKHLLSTRLKCQNPLLSYIRER